MLPTPSRSRGACSKALSSPRSWMRTSTPAQQSSLRRSHPMMRIERAPLFLNVRMGENKHGRFAQHPHPNHDFTRPPGTRLGAFARIPPLTRRYLGGLRRATRAPHRHEGKEHSLGSPSSSSSTSTPRNSRTCSASFHEKSFALSIEIRRCQEIK